MRSSEIDKTMTTTQFTQEKLEEKYKCGLQDFPYILEETFTFLLRFASFLNDF